VAAAVTSRLGAPGAGRAEGEVAGSAQAASAPRVNTAATTDTGLRCDAFAEQIRICVLLKRRVSNDRGMGGHGVPGASAPRAGRDVREAG
jgi:hypothetical protein